MGVILQTFRRARNAAISEAQDQLLAEKQVKGDNYRFETSKHLQRGVKGSKEVWEVELWVRSGTKRFSLDTEVKADYATDGESLADLLNS